MIKYTKILVASIMAAVIVFAGCSAKSTSSIAAPSAAYAQEVADNGFAGRVSTVQESEAEAPAADMASPANPAIPAGPAALQDRKIIKHSNLSLETKEFDVAIPEIISLVTSAGGYIEGQSLDGKSLNYSGNYYERYARISARVPADKLAEVTALVGELCNITSQSENMDDITDSYFDTKAHLDTLTIQEERLLEILKKAEKLEDVITLEKALSDTRYQIESLTAAMKRMDSQIAYSYLNIELREVAEYNELTAAPKTFGEKLAASSTRAGDHLIKSVQGFILLVVEAAPVLLLWLAVAACIALAIRSFLRRSKKNKMSGAIETPKDTESPEDKI